MIAFTLEALAPSRKITSGVMLVPALSPNYDLRTAVSRTERGIWNFCSYGDVVLPGSGDTALRNDRWSTLYCGWEHGVRPSCRRAVPCERPAAIRNVPYRWEMFRAGHTGGHLSVTTAEFASQEIAPLFLPREK